MWEALLLVSVRAISALGRPQTVDERLTKGIRGNPLSLRKQPMQTPDDAHPFRDSSAGVNAKRDKLLGARRADLAYMSHAIRRTFVSRSARTGASIALALGGAILLAATVSSDFAGFVITLLPGEAPAPLANLLFGTWIFAALGGLVARSISERRFTLAMSKAVLPSEDAHQDVARLAHETPDEVGRRMAHRQGRIGRALPILAAGFVLPATAIAAKLAIAAGGYPSLDSFEYILPTSSALAIGVASLATLFAGVLYFKPNRATLALPILTVVHAIFVGALWPYLVVGAIALAVLAWRIQQRQLHEEIVLGEDGAPLPKPLYLRKRLQSALGRLVSQLREIRSWRPRRVHALGLGLVAVAGASLYMHTSAKVVQAHPNEKLYPHMHPGSDGLPDKTSGDVQLVENGDGLTMKFNFNGQDGALDAGYLLEGAMIPPGWRATVNVYNLGASGAFALSFFGDEANLPPRHLSHDQGTLTVQHDNCSSEPLPLAISATPYGVQEFDSENSNLTLRYRVTLELVNECY